MQLFRGRHSKTAMEAQRKRQDGWLYCVCALPEDLEPPHVENIWTCPRCGTMWHLHGLSYTEDGQIYSTAWTKVVSDNGIREFLEQNSE